MRGIMRSTMMTAYTAVASFSSAATPSPAVSMVNASRPSAAVSMPRMATSSSTIRIRGKVVTSFPYAIGEPAIAPKKISGAEERPQRPRNDCEEEGRTSIRCRPGAVRAGAVGAGAVLCAGDVEVRGGRLQAAVGVAGGVGAEGGDLGPARACPAEEEEVRLVVGVVLPRDFDRRGRERRGDHVARRCRWRRRC